MKKSDDTAITHHDGGTTLTGDAITLYRYGVLLQAVKMWHNNHMLLSRNATMKIVLPQIAKICGKDRYTNTRQGREAAMADLTRTIETLKVAIPHVDERTNREE